MSSLKVFDMQGAAIGDVDVADELLVLDKGTQAVHDAVVAAGRARRAGTASTLTKGEVSGSNRKPWRQKGTGRARAGYRQSPVWRGGGVAFGPHPRDYGVKLNRKVSRLAFCRALSERIAAGKVTVIDSLEFEKPATKSFVGLMQAMELTAPLLVVVDRMESNVALSIRNVPRVDVAEARSVSVYEVLRYPRLLVTKAGLEALKARLAR